MKKSKPTKKKLFKTSAKSEMNSAAAKKLRKASQKESDEVFELLESSKDGISPGEAKNVFLSTV
ncbi:MAG TPA: hypothetical protein VKY37_11435 [Brumimicrobium sp.]|nr:hypothetical protein [Brumimicrobium sp.]